MKAAVVSLFPELVEAALDIGIVGRARREGRFDCAVVSPRDHADDTRKTIDDRPFGGGPGMVMMAEPLRRAVAAAKAAASAQAPVILLTPQGERFDQRFARRLARSPGFVLVAARYEGADERFTEESVDCELSIGDYVLSGGEPAALAVLDAVARLLPGAARNPASTAEDSFTEALLDHPHYTRPEHHRHGSAPDILLSGDHAAIARWRRREALARTWRRRPDLLLDRDLGAADRAMLADIVREPARA